jgi:hypothetical protein
VSIDNKKENTRMNPQEKRKQDIERLENMSPKELISEANVAIVDGQARGFMDQATARFAEATALITLATYRQLTQGTEQPAGEHSVQERPIPRVPLGVEKP